MSYKLPEDLEVRSGQRSKYRVIIESIFEYFVDNPTENIARIVCEYGADSDNLAKKVKMWLRDDEELYVIKKGKIVYFLRDDDG